jgi:lipopolysaccharide/colanic/teichoic acid biosynthesis glycosyltransferase
MYWDSLPEAMRTEEVRNYYELLSSKKAGLIIKRIFDIVLSLVLIVLLSWLLIILAIMIKVDSPGPVFYRQVRVTRGNRDFRIFKFRTMVDKADQMGSLVTTGKDSRITKVGAKLRKCRLDELPQLFNVLRGDMTFVGTRPEVRKYVNEYTPEMMATLLMPAGITSPASINFKDEDQLMDRYTAEGMNVDQAYTEKVLPEKMKYNLDYIRNYGFFYDLRIMAATAVGVMS